MPTILSHFPDSRTKWKSYSKVFFPVVIGSMFFALNSFVDNFMVGRYNGAGALAVANTWTSIISGIFIGVASAGAIVLAQYYYDGQYKKTKEASRIRFLVTFVLVLIFAIFAWVIPDTLNKVFLREPTNGVAAEKVIYETTLRQAREYLQVIAIQWVLMSITFNLGNQLREIGYAKVPLIWSFFTLATNVILNIVLIQVIDIGVAGAAWASVVARVIALIVGTSFIYFKKLPIGTLPWKIFDISPKIAREFFKRWYLIVSLASAFLFINFRFFFYDLAYPLGSIATGIGAIAVLGLTGAIMNVFTSSFSATRVLAANFVGSELGRGNLKQAKINSNQLRGFNTLMSLGFSLILLVFASFVPQFTFIVNDNVDASQANAVSIDVVAQLANVRTTLYVVAGFFPTWIFFVTTYDNANSGGRNGIMAFVEWVSGIIQIAWCALLMVVIVPSSPTLLGNFAISYAIFFIIDIVKLIMIEITYWKVNWAHSITYNKTLNAKNTNDVELKKVKAKSN